MVEKELMKALFELLGFLLLLREQLLIALIICFLLVCIVLLPTG